MAIQELAPTANFRIRYEDCFKYAVQRAESLRTICETDFDTLQGWFGMTGGFGAGNPVTVLIDSEGGGWNNGYHADATITLKIEAFDASATSAAADDAVRGLFVGEMIEVLMSYSNFTSGKKTWHPSQSDGESLSRVTAALLHPVGYYTPLKNSKGDPVLLGPILPNTWLNSVRSDWITKNELSDSMPNSLGCGILFIYYLKSQLGFSINDIVSKAGDTLEATYRNLTGESGAYSTFTSFLTRCGFPAGSTIALKSDNPFPICDSRRSVTVSLAEDTPSSRFEVVDGVAHIQPAPGCAAKDYNFKIYEDNVELRATASVRGFAQPVYNWRINGKDVTATEIYNIPVTIYIDDPTQPTLQKVEITTGQVWVRSFTDVSTWRGMASELAIGNVDHAGHFQLTVDVAVSEKFTSAGSLSAGATGFLDTTELVFDSDYYADRAACIRRLVGVLVEPPLLFWIEQILGIKLPQQFPGPPQPPRPGIEVFTAVHIVQEIVREIQTIARRDVNSAEQVTRAVADVLQVSPNLFAWRQGLQNSPQ